VDLSCRRVGRRAGRAAASVEQIDRVQKGTRACHRIVRHHEDWRTTKRCLQRLHVFARADAKGGPRFLTPAQTPCMLRGCKGFAGKTKNNAVRRYSHIGRSRAPAQSLLFLICCVRGPRRPLRASIVVIPSPPSVGPHMRAQSSDKCHRRWSEAMFTTMCALAAAGLNLTSVRELASIARAASRAIHHQRARREACANFIKRSIGRRGAMLSRTSGRISFRSGKMTFL